MRNVPISIIHVRKRLPKQAKKDKKVRGWAQPWQMLETAAGNEKHRGLTMSWSYHVLVLPSPRRTCWPIWPFKIVGMKCPLWLERIQVDGVALLKNSLGSWARIG